MIEVENTDVNIVRNLIPMRNHMPASAYGLKAISDWFFFQLSNSYGNLNLRSLISMNSNNLFSCFLFKNRYFHPLKT